MISHQSHISIDPHFLMLGKELDRLNVKWQRELGARPDETFYSQYDRARALESERSSIHLVWTETLVEINRSLLERSRRVVPKAVLVKEM